MSIGFAAHTVWTLLLPHGELGVEAIRESMLDNRIILVPHPGQERLPARGTLDVPWPSVNAHRRKFIRAEGEWHLTAGNSGTGWLEFWGEYEGPTSCQMLSGGPGMPTAVHSIEEESGPATLNTDPWVFYPGFVWATCRHGMLRGQASHGDIVLFGSSIGGDWVLDTVLVVDRQIPEPTGHFGSVYDRLVLATLPPVQPFVGRCYSGHSQPFSFVPASRADNGHQPFRRPVMNALLGTLKTRTGAIPSPNNAQALVVCLAMHGALAFWAALTRCIEDSGLVFGTMLHYPAASSSPTAPRLGAAACGGRSCTVAKPLGMLPRSTSDCAESE